MTSNEDLRETIQRLDTAIRGLNHSVEALTESTKQRDSDLSRSILALTESTKLQIEIMREDYKLVRADLQKIDKEVRAKASQDSVETLRTELNNKLDVILKAVAPFHHNPFQHVRFEK